MFVGGTTFYIFSTQLNWVQEFVGDEKFSILFSRDLWDSLWESLREFVGGGSH